MILREFYEPAPQGYQDIDDDNSKPKWGESRKTRLTLGMLSKIRQMNDVKAFERAKELKSIRAQYKPAADAGGL